MTLGRTGADAGSAPAGVGGTKGQSGRGGRRAALGTSPVACGRLTPRPPPGKQEPCMRVKGNASDGLSLVALWLTPGSAVWTDGAAASSEAAGRGRGTLPVPLPPPGETGTRGLTEEILGRVLLVVSVLWEVIDFLAHPSEGPCGDETDRVLSLGPPRRGEGAPSAPGRPHETRLPQDADGGARRAGVGRVAEAWHCLPPRLCQILESARSAESYEADSFARRPVPPSSLPQLGRSGEKGSRVL